MSMDRRAFIAGAAGTGAAAVLGMSGAASAESARRGWNAHGHIRTLTAITQVFGEGQKLVAVAVEYDAVISRHGLSTTTFAVADRTVTAVYPNSEPRIAASGRDGRYVIVELSPEDDAALLWVHIDNGGGGVGAGGPSVGDNTPGYKIVPASADVTQTGSVYTVRGRTYPALTEALPTTGAINLIVDEFTQHTYTDAATGRTLGYNLFLPRGYNRHKRYPLVLFMHDAGVIAVDTIGPLVQGLGAVCWASPEDQARHECIVVAPEYPEVVIGDDYQPSTYFEATVNLVNEIASTYAVDRSRMHATGQSMGAMLALGMNIRHPGMFASSFIVAGQWPSDQAAPLAKEKLWVLVSQDDEKAYPMEQAIMDVVESEGTEVATGVWNGESTPAQFAADVRSVAEQHAPVNFTSFASGTLPTDTQAHPETWRVAYTIPGIRDWILQRRGHR